jgi:hypothetical protein
VENQLEQTATSQEVATPVTANTEALPPATPMPAMPESFKVKVLDLHTEDRFEYVVSNMNDAINLYKQVVAAARNVEPRPFVYLDDAQWIALVKFSGGLVRQCWIVDSTGKVRGHNAGMRRREAMAQNPVALPPSIIPAARPIAASIPEVALPAPVVTHAPSANVENVGF